jgi:transcription termination factor Rho
MSVLDRESLEASPLADLYVIASELTIDGHRRLRKAELVDAILARQGGDPGPGSEPAEPDDEPAARTAEREERPARSRSRRGGRGRGRDRDRDRDRDRPSRPSREDPDEADEDSSAEAGPAEGVVELLGNGSGFVRVSPPDPSDDDVYISAAQVRRCELVSGDKVTGPVRPPRRSERYPSLVRVDTINGAPADQVAAGTRYDDLPAAFPDERFALGSEDLTIRAIEWLTPFGRGSRVSIVGIERAGKTETLLRLAAALAAGAGGDGGYQLSVVLAGVRPEEIGVWQAGPAAPSTAVSFAASPDSQAQAVEGAIEQARRRAARGGHVVLLVDTLDALTPTAARRALGAARRIVDGGSLTIVATARTPVGGETTVIALDAKLAGARRYPALDLRASGVLRPEQLVGEAGAEAIATARAEASAHAADG